jgi:hypothetical protein
MGEDPFPGANVIPGIPVSQEALPLAERQVDENAEEKHLRQGWEIKMSVEFH